MHIAVNEIEYCKLLIQCETDHKIISEKKSDILKKFKEQKVPGFRPGHATPEAIKQHYKKEIAEALKQELADDAVHNVIFEKKLKPLGRPQFNYANLEESYLVLASGESALPKFKCEFILNVQPEFELKQYKEFEIPKAAGIPSTEELTQKILQELRSKNGSTVPYGADDFVQMGDTVIVDYTTSLDGQNIKDLTDTGQILSIGRINIPGFSESLLGMKAEETREFDLHMPENYRPEYVGKTLHFVVKVTMGSKVEFAALDDELAKKVGLENFDALMSNVTGVASARVRELENMHYLDQISRRLVTEHDFKIPEWIGTGEAQINARNAGAKWEEIPDEQKLKHIDMAEKSVKLSLILQKIRDKEPEAQLTDEEVFGLAKENIAKYSQEPDKVIQEIYKNGHLSLLFNRMRDEYTLNFILKNSKIVE